MIVSTQSTCRFLSTLGLLIAAPLLLAENWKSLEEDELHDPSNPAVNVLQQPAEALSVLAPDSAGNKVDWVEAVRLGQIAPRSSLDNSAVPETLDTDIIMSNTLSVAPVLFPHKEHSDWMSCSMCHDSIFVAQTDANAINMSKILEGEYCGVCHGAVSFPLTECDRCHSVINYTQMAPSSSGVPVEQK